MTDDTIRVVRILEYVGPRWWIEQVLDKSWLTMGKAELGANKHIQELTRVVEVLND